MLQPETDSTLPDDLIDGYRLVSEIGRGGMAVVYLAERTGSDFSRRVAIKLLHGSPDRESVRRRFEFECSILSGLEHPNIAGFIDGGTTASGIPYLIIEYVEGLPLIEFADDKRLGLEGRISLFREICNAVSFAHRRAVIHRDLKPANIRVTNSGSPKLLDFGIAKLLESEASDLSPMPTSDAITPEYASPEQLRNEAVTTLSDVYSLGVMLYELLTGQRPYGSETRDLQHLVRQICEVEPQGPSTVASGAFALRLKGDIDNIVLKALNKDADARYASVDEFSADLERFSQGLPVLARGDSPFYRAGKFIRRNYVAVAFACISAVILIAGIATTVWQTSIYNEQRLVAERRFQDVRSLANSLVFELNAEIYKGQTQGSELVVKRALEYLDKLAVDAGDSDDLQRDLAVAYIKVGDIQGKPYAPNLGQTDASLESYLKAARIFQDLEKRGVRDADTLRGKASAHLSIAQHYSHRSHHPTAIEHVRPAIEILVPLAESGDEGTMQLLAEAYRSLGDASWTSEEKVAAYSNALAYAERLASLYPDRPENLATVASMNQRLGTRLSAIAENEQDDAGFREALANFDRGREIYRRLIEIDPSDGRNSTRYAHLTSARVPILGRLRMRDEAVSSHEEALAIFQKHAAADPQNAEAKLNLAYTLQEGCKGYLQLPEPQRAVAVCRRGLEIAVGLFRADRANNEVRGYIRRSHLLIAEAEERAGNVGALTAQIAEIEKLRQIWPPDTDQGRDHLTEMIAIVEQRLGNAYRNIACGKALVWYGKSRDRFQELYNVDSREDDYLAAIRKIDEDRPVCG